MSLVSLLCINGYPVISEEVQLYSVVSFCFVFVLGFFNSLFAKHLIDGFAFRQP